MRSLDEFATAKLGELERSSLRRALVDTTRVTAIWLLRNGRRLLSFCCNDYLNLTNHPAVKEAAIEALRVHGVGAVASRLVTGNHRLFSELEARLAGLKETEATCVFGSGYLANLGIIPALIGPDDLVLIDELAHACLWAGARLARAAVVPFRHADVGHVELLLAQLRRRHRHALIATDGVFSMDAALPVAKAKAFARGAGLPEPVSPIVPVLLGEAEAALKASRLLEDDGFLVVAIRPPTVPAGTARLRLTFTAQHPDDEIERLAEVVRTRILAHAPASVIEAQ